MKLHQLLYFPAEITCHKKRAGLRYNTEFQLAYFFCFLFSVFDFPFSVFDFLSSIFCFLLLPRTLLLIRNLQKYKTKCKENCQTSYRYINRTAGELDCGNYSRAKERRSLA